MFFVLLEHLPNNFGIFESSPSAGADLLHPRKRNWSLESKLSTVQFDSTFPGPAQTSPVNSSPLQCSQVQCNPVKLRPSPIQSSQVKSRLSPSNRLLTQVLQTWGRHLETRSSLPGKSLVRETVMINFSFITKIKMGNK